MRGFAALFIGAAAACAPTAPSDRIVLFPDLLSLPLVEGGRIIDCAETRPADWQWHAREVCVQLASGSEKRARDFYRDHMIYVAGWARVRTYEALSDGWILPGVPETHCLFVSVYGTMNDAVIAEFQLAKIESEDGRVDVCDMSIG